jgi:hypothetical protein
VKELQARRLRTPVMTPAKAVGKRDRSERHARPSPDPLNSRNAIAIQSCVAGGGRVVWLPSSDLEYGGRIDRKRADVSPDISASQTMGKVPIVTGLPLPSLSPGEYRVVVEVQSSSRPIAASTGLVTFGVDSADGVQFAKIVPSIHRERRLVRRALGTTSRSHSPRLGTNRALVEPPFDEPAGSSQTRASVPQMIRTSPVRSASPRDHRTTAAGQDPPTPVRLVEPAEGAIQELVVPLARASSNYLDLGGHRTARIRAGSARRFQALPARQLVRSAQLPKRRPMSRSHPHDTLILANAPFVPVIRYEAHPPH